MNARPRRPMRLLALVLSLSTLGLAAFAATGANAYLYWTQQGGTTVERTTAGGADATRTLVSGGKFTAGVAVGAGHVYWADVGTSSIGRANLDGTGVEPEFIKGAVQPAGVAVDAGHIYWSSFIPGLIGRAALDGSKPEPEFIKGASAPQGIAVDSGHLYWASYEANSIGRANLAGGEVEPEWITGPTLPVGIAVDGGHVYWGSNGSNSIGRANLAGGEVESALRPAQLIVGLAVGKSPSTTTLSTSSEKAVWKSTITLTATVGGVEPTGPVTFSADGSPLGAVPLSAGAAALSTSSLGLGKHTITAAYGGDEGNAASQSAPLSVSVVEPKPKVALHYSPNTPHKPNPKGGPRWTFRFSSDLPGTTFVCSLDGGSFKPCSSPKVYRNLKKGKHTFRVRSRSAEGLESAPQTVKFRARQPR